MSGYIQQFKLFLPSSLDARHYLSLIASERDILLVDIPVAGFQFLDQPAFGYLPVPDQPVISDIIGQRCDQEGIFFRSGCTSYAVSSNRLLAENPPALPSYRLSVSRGEESCDRTPHTEDGFRASPSCSLIQATALFEQPVIRRGNPGLGKQPGNKEKVRTQRANSLFLIRLFCLITGFHCQRSEKGFILRIRREMDECRIQSA